MVLGGLLQIRLARDQFDSNANVYERLSYRSARVPGVDGRVLVTSDAGEFVFLTSDEFSQLEAGTLHSTSPKFDDLLAKQLIRVGGSSSSIRIAEAKLRTKKAFMREGQTLHIFVVSLRCNHSCAYCQVSRQGVDDKRFDMSSATAVAAVDRMFESSARNLTVEFQGGEPLLAFERIVEIVELVEARRNKSKRGITYTITSTLHHLSEEILEFFKLHKFQISTSIDGPSELHNANRPTPDRDAHARTLSGLCSARNSLGANSISALTTLTKRSLSIPEAIVDEYVRLGFRSIFLRPLSPYGFARRSTRKLGYDMTEFVSFYERALAYILELNRRGVQIEEAYASILLTHILTPFASNYVDLRSPTGAGFGVLVYNYDGGVYASDESRMLAEMGDDLFRLGSVHDPLPKLMESQAMSILRRTGIAEELPVCRDCAFLPYCGADPVHAHATQGDPAGDRLSSEHCVRHLGLFRILFRYLDAADPEVMRTFLAWINKKPRSVFVHEAKS